MRKGKVINQIIEKSGVEAFRNLESKKLGSVRQKITRVIGDWRRTILKETTEKYLRNSPLYTLIGRQTCY